MKLKYIFPLLFDFSSFVEGENTSYLTSDISYYLSSEMHEAKRMDSFGFNERAEIDGNLEQQKRAIFEAFSRSLYYLRTQTVQEVLKAMFFNLNDKLRSTIAARARGIDHVGFMMPGANLLKQIEPQIAMTTGLHLLHEVDSVIVAKELGKKLNRETVPTQINTYATNKVAPYLGQQVEVFVPEASAFVSSWVKERVTQHIAIAMRSLSALQQVTDLLLQQGYQMPAFMNGKLMENALQGTTTAYFDMSSKFGMRVEFLYNENYPPMRDLA